MCHSLSVFPTPPSLSTMLLLHDPILPFSAVEICANIRNMTFHVFLLKMFVDTTKVGSALKLPLTVCSA